MVFGFYFNCDVLLGLWQLTSLYSLERLIQMDQDGIRMEQDEIRMDQDDIRMDQEYIQYQCVNKSERENWMIPDYCVGFH